MNLFKRGEHGKRKAIQMGKRSWQGGSVRTTIILNRDLHRELRRLMIAHGYGKNFSAFIADCAREKRARLMQQAALPAKEKGVRS